MRKSKSHCYICHSLLKESSPFNGNMCPKCGYLNQQKKEMTADLSGYIALLTGGRIKIGYETGLKLLRSKAKVIITTRFPIDAALRYSKENDFNDWKDNLIIYKVDFRNLTQVDNFIRTLTERLPYIDILINNAAQTIRRPAEYYEHLREIETIESQNVPNNVRSLIYPLGSHFNFFGYQKQLDRGLYAQKQLEGKPINLNNYDLLFPHGKKDCEGMQLDLRRSNSWISKIEDISIIELLEVQIVNSTVPFLLCGRLKNLFKQSPNKRRFIINVSAMEGCFSKYHKNVYHPHTNMAKASLNMITRTIAKDYKKHNIYVNSVDTGWITDENPNHIKEKNERIGLRPPLDCIDGAARVCAPIFDGINDEKSLSYGHFFKDYHIINW